MDSPLAASDEVSDGMLGGLDGDEGIVTLDSLPLPVFDPRQLAAVPIPSSESLRSVMQNEVNVGPPKVFTKNFVNHYLSTPSQKLLTASFWYLLIHHFRHKTTPHIESYKAALFDLMSVHYTATVHGSKNRDMEAVNAGLFDVLRHYPDVAAQTLFSVFYACFPSSRKQFDDDFKRLLVMDCQYWFTGLIAKDPSVEHWRHHRDMEKARNQMEKEKETERKRIEQFFGPMKSKRRILYDSDEDEEDRQAQPQQPAEANPTNETERLNTAGTTATTTTTTSSSGSAMNVLGGASGVDGGRSGSPRGRLRRHHHHGKSNVRIVRMEDIKRDLPFVHAKPELVSSSFLNTTVVSRSSQNQQQLQQQQQQRGNTSGSARQGTTANNNVVGSGGSAGDESSEGHISSSLHHISKAKEANTNAALAPGAGGGPVANVVDEDSFVAKAQAHGWNIRPAFEESAEWMGRNASGTEDTPPRPTFGGPPPDEGGHINSAKWRTKGEYQKRFRMERVSPLTHHFLSLIESYNEFVGTTNPSQREGLFSTINFSDTDTVPMVAPEPQEPPSPLLHTASSSFGLLGGNNPSAPTSATNIIRRATLGVPVASQPPRSPSVSSASALMAQTEKRVRMAMQKSLSTKSLLDLPLRLDDSHDDDEESRQEQDDRNDEDGGHRRSNEMSDSEVDEVNRKLGDEAMWSSGPSPTSLISASSLTSSPMPVMTSNNNGPLQHQQQPSSHPSRLPPRVGGGKSRPGGGGGVGGGRARTPLSNVRGVVPSRAQAHSKAYALAPTDPQNMAGFLSFIAHRTGILGPVSAHTVVNPDLNDDVKKTQGGTHVKMNSSARRSVSLPASLKRIPNMHWSEPEPAREDFISRCREVQHRKQEILTYDQVQQQARDLLRRSRQAEFHKTEIILEGEYQRQLVERRERQVQKMKAAVRDIIWKIREMRTLRHADDKGVERIRLYRQALDVVDEHIAHIPGRVRSLLFEFITKNRPVLRSMIRQYRLHNKKKIVEAYQAGDTEMVYLLTLPEDLEELQKRLGATIGTSQDLTKTIRQKLKDRVRMDASVGILALLERKQRIDRKTAVAEYFHNMAKMEKEDPGALHWRRQKKEEELYYATHPAHQMSLEEQLGFAPDAHHFDEDEAPAEGSRPVSAMSEALSSPSSPTSGGTRSVGFGSGLPETPSSDALTRGTSSSAYLNMLAKKVAREDARITMSPTPDQPPSSPPSQPIDSQAIDTMDAALENTFTALLTDPNASSTIPITPPLTVDPASSSSSRPSVFITQQQQPEEKSSVSVRKSSQSQSQSGGAPPPSSTPVLPALPQPSARKAHVPNPLALTAEE